MGLKYLLQNLYIKFKQECLRAKLSNILGLRDKFCEMFHLNCLLKFA